MKLITMGIPALMFICGFAAFSEEKNNAFSAAPDKSLTTLTADNGAGSNELLLIGTPGEYEASCFKLKALEDVNAAKISIGDFKNKDGRTIPASAADIRIIKDWYQSGNSEKAQAPHNLGRRILTPELLLHDDSLIKVDCEKKENYVRLNTPGNEDYYWISNPDDKNRQKDLPLANDSDKLLPVNFKNGEERRFWLTIKIPEDAKAGIYETSIMESDKKLLDLKLRVLPFKLSVPRTYYDPEKDFISSMLYDGALYSAPYLWNKTPSAYKKEIKNLIAHGVDNPSLRQSKDGFSEKSLAEILKIRKESGMNCDYIFYTGSYIDFFFQKGGCDAVKKEVKRVIDFVKPYGVKDVYFYGLDEALNGKKEGIEKFCRQRQIWEAVHEAGGKIFVAGVKVGHYQGESSKGNWGFMGDIQDVLVCYGASDKEEAARWHSKGHLIFCYANPQGGFEDPDRYRKNFGFTLWRNNYDGAMTYCYIWQRDYVRSWNDFIQPVGMYRSHNMVYPTPDGVIDTIQWEGYREGIDDVKYASTLKEAIKEGKNSENENIRKIAREADEYLEKLDTEKNDPSIIRLEMIRYILKLKGM